jgi:hypothetical protein
MPRTKEVSSRVNERTIEISKGFVFIAMPMGASETPARLDAAVTFGWHPFSIFRLSKNLGPFS